MPSPPILVREAVQDSHQHCPRDSFKIVKMCPVPRCAKVCHRGLREKRQFQPTVRQKRCTCNATLASSELQPHSCQHALDSSRPKESTPKSLYYIDNTTTLSYTAMDAPPDWLLLKDGSPRRITASSSILPIFADFWKYPYTRSNAWDWIGVYYIYIYIYMCIYMFIG